MILLSRPRARSHAAALDQHLKLIGQREGNLKTYAGRRASRQPRPGASRRGARLPSTRAVGRLRPPRLQLPLGLGPRRARRLPRASIPTAGSKVAENPVKQLQEASTAAAASMPPTTTRLLARAAAARGARAAPTSTVPPTTAPPRRPSDRVLLRRVRIARLVPDLQRRPRRPRRRHPQGGVRPCVAAGRGRPPLPQRLLPPAHRQPRLAARVLGRHRPGPPARRAGHRRRRRADHDQRQGRRPRGRRADLAHQRRPDPAATCSTPTARRTPRPPAGSPPASTSATRTPAWRSTCCSASAACARSRRWGSSRASCTSTRVTRRSSSLELARREYSGSGSIKTALEIAQKRTVFTTHTPVPAGNDTYPAHQVEGVLEPHRRHARRGPGGDHQPRPHQPGRGSGAVRRHAVRAAHLPRRQRRRPSATARSPARCGTRCGPTRPSTTSRSPT